MPHDKLSPKPIMKSPSAKLPPPYPPPRQTGRMIGPPPPPRIPAQPRTVPPRYVPPMPRLVAPTSPPPLLRSASVSCRPRPPPPPYPRGAAHQKPPPPLPLSNLPVSPQSSRALNRFRPDLALNDKDSCHNNGQGNGSDSFAPQQTSTPRSEKSFVFNSPPPSVFNPGNNSMVQSPDYEDGDVLRKQSLKTTDAPMNKRKDVLSFYENIENFSCAPSASLESRDSSTTLTSDVIPDSKKERDNSIWYEYGCV